MPDRSLSDEILVKKAKEGDISAFEELFDRYKKRILNFIYRLIYNKETAEEVAQEVFMKVYNNIDIFDPNKKFSSWIYTIARNLAKNAIRDKKYFRDISLEQTVSGEDNVIKLKDVLASADLSPDLIIENEELNQEAQKVLDSLPLKYKEVITLCSIQALTYREAAGILGVSAASISIRLNEAKIVFMKKLGISFDGSKDGSDRS